MSDNPQTVAAESNTTNAAETETENDDATAFKTLDDVQKRYFAPEEIEEGGQYFLAAQEVAKKHGQGAFVSNFDFNEPMGSEKGFPEGYGLAIIPISVRTDANKNETVSVVAAAVPTSQQIATAEGGQAFIDELIISALMTKVANSARPRSGQTGMPILPRSLADFMEGGRRESTKGFMEVAPAFVKKLKAKGMKNITVAMLRECVQSKAIAEQYFPKVTQEAWTKLANAIVAMGEAKKLDMSVVKHWIDTRDEAGMKVVDDDALLGVLEGLGE